MIADVLNRHQEDLYKLCANSWQSRTLHALRKCRTIALGGHWETLKGFAENQKI